MVAIAATVGGTACVPNLAAPARTADGYRAAVLKSTGAAGSAVGTAALVARSGADDQAFLPYLSITVSDAEDQLGSVETTFASIEPPPDAAAIELRRRTTEVLQRAGADIADVRIAIRQGDRAPLPALADALSRDADDLEQLGS